MGQNVLAPLFDDSDRSELRLSISVVPVETFSETVVAVDVSNCQDLVTCDLGGIVTTRGARRNLLAWQETLSDIVGCIQLRHPTPLAPTAPLKAKDCPVPCLLDELQELGPLSSVLLRTAGATTLWFSMAGTYPARGIIFSACWWGGRIHARGVDSFANNRAQGCYQLSSHGNSEVCSARDYKERLQGLGGPLLADETRAAKRPRVGGEPPAPAVEVAGAPPTPVVAGDPAPPDDELIVAGGPEENVLPAGILEYIDGGRVTYKEGPGGERGLRLHCAHHAGCETYRSMARNPFGRGRRAAVFDFGVWQQGGAGITKEAHSKAPRKDAVVAYAAAHM